MECHFTECRWLGHVMTELWVVTRSAACHPARSPASAHTHTHTHGGLIKTEEYTYNNCPVLSDCLIPYSRIPLRKLTVAELLPKKPHPLHRESCHSVNFRKATVSLIFHLNAQVQLNIFNVLFLLGNSTASEFYLPSTRSTVCSIFIGAVGRKNNRDETVGYLCGKRFGSRIGRGVDREGRARVEKQARPGQDGAVSAETRSRQSANNINNQLYMCV
jgi:hypothetical protein